MDFYKQYEETERRGAQIAVRGIGQAMLYLLKNGSRTIRVQLASTEIPLEWLMGIRVILGLKDRVEISYRTKIDPLPLIDGDKRWVQMYLQANSGWEEALSKETTYCAVDSLRLEAEGEKRVLELKNAESRGLLFERELDKNFGEDLSKLLQEQGKLNIDGSKLTLENLDDYLIFLCLYRGMEQKIQLNLKPKIKVFTGWLRNIQVVATIEKNGKNIENAYDVVEVEPGGIVGKPGSSYTLHLKEAWGTEIKISNGLIWGGRVKSITLRSPDSERIFRHVDTAGFKRT